MAQLPQELFIEILLWLPVESLLRFRSLSKSLCALIDSSDFINSHLCKSSSQNFNLRKLIFQEPYREKFHVCDFNLYLQEEENLGFHNPVLSSTSLWKQFLWQEVFGYCKGLLLLYRNSLRPTELALALWNPSTRKRRDLPDCPLESPDFVETYRITGCGLGYDDSNDDYKAFFILDVFHKFEPKLEVQVWIYSLKSNDWRRSQNFPYPDYKIDTDPGIAGIGYFTTDGTLHWLCTLFSNPWKSEIVCFDMQTETFSILHLPVCSVDEVSSQLHVLEGCLCVSFFSGRYFSLFGPGSTMPTQADLYMRKKNDVDDQITWIKLYSVTETTPLRFHVSWFQSVDVLGYLNGGDKILLDFGMDYLVSYDLEERFFNRFETYNTSGYWNGPILCLESLVSVRGGAIEA